LLIFSEQISNRLTYTLDFIFKDYLKVEYALTDDKNKFRKYNKAKIFYGEDNTIDAFVIPAEKLLFETDVHPCKVSVEEIGGVKVLFPANSKKADFPFDIFAAVFYQLSRYEEYNYKFSKNQFRFPAAESIAYKHQFLNLPIVHIWIEELVKAIKNKFPEFEFSHPQYKFLPTFDIDNAYAYLYKSFWRTVGATAKSVFLFRFSDYFDRWLTFFGIQQDKYDSYDYIKQIVDENNLQPVWFFLLGNYGKFDKNIKHNRLEFKKLISALSQKYQTGIHPSFTSNDKKEQLSTEIYRLEQITGKKVNKSRQHFLRMQLPGTYRQLIEAGITEDYSLGYAEELGFRAGVAVPFYFFDIEQDKKTNLKIIPFQMMDVTLRRYKQYTIEESQNVLKSLIKITQKYHGTFVSLWHNESLGTDKYWMGWRSVFVTMVKCAKENEC